MKKNPVPARIMVTGDNSIGQLWMKGDTQVTAKFTEANAFMDDCPPAQITHVSAFEQSIAFAINDTKVIFRKQDQTITKFVTGIIRSLVCLNDTVLVLQFDGKIFDCANQEYYDGSDYKYLAASSKFVVATTSKGDVHLYEEGSRKKHKTIATRGTVVGCTDTDIFISNEKGLEKYTDGITSQIKTENNIIAISASDSEALFIDVKGKLWTYNSDALLRVYGLPPVVFASVGIQHFAAISYDGELYTWGFNPSGQLGIGSDRPTNDPANVLSGVRLVACGTHHTLAVSGDSPEIPQQMDVSALTKLRPILKTEPARIARAELLF